MSAITKTSCFPKGLNDLNLLGPEIPVAALNSLVDSSFRREIVRENSERSAFTPPRKKSPISEIEVGTLHEVLDYAGEPHMTRCVSKLWQQHSPKDAQDAVRIPDREAFFASIREGDLNGVKAYIEAGGDIEARQEGLTALMVLADSQKWKPENEEIFNYLIKKRANVHAVKLKHLSEGNQYIIETAMHSAVLKANAAIIPLLARAGAALNVRQEHGGRTPLHLAAREHSGDSSCARALLQSRADPNVYCAIGNSARLPLQTALENCNLETAKLLITSKADVNLNEKSDLDPTLYSPLRIASRALPAAIPFIVAAGANVTLKALDAERNHRVPHALANFIKHGFILQTFRIEGIAKIIFEYTKNEKEVDEILHASIMQSPELPYVNPFTFLSSNPKGIVKIQNDQLRAQMIFTCVPVTDLVQIITAYLGDWSREEVYAAGLAAKLPLLRVSWECEAEERIVAARPPSLRWFFEEGQEARARQASKINKQIGQLPDDGQEILYTELFLRSKDPAKPAIDAPLEAQLRWAKEHVGDDLRLLSDVIETLYYGK